MAQLPEGILLIDKPVGISTFDVLRRLTKLYGKKKRGYAGTLDPLASGLVIVAEGKATKLLTEYLKLPKTYEAEVCIGESSTTGDREGEVTERLEVAGMSEESVRDALESMKGTLDLPVPAYSAIKQGGVPLYKKARRGEEVVVPIKPMEVRDAKLLSFDTRDGYGFAKTLFDVGSGTYIRSLAVELGKRLGYPARLENLRRPQVGEWRGEDAFHIESFVAVPPKEESAPGR